MKNLPHLFENNKAWAEKIERDNPGFFKKLSAQQKPEYLWIGCSDSRVPANEIVGLLPGELFVHRNVSNLVVHADVNCLSVIQFATEVLNVKHIIVCGHYDCGGIKAAVENSASGLIDTWLMNIRALYSKKKSLFDDIKNHKKKIDTLCELNVIEQVNNVCLTTIVQDAWNRGQELSVHGWIYAISDGLLKDLEVTISSIDEFKKYRQSI